MAQFTVYENPNPDTSDEIPYLLDVQADLLESMNTRVVVPLHPLDPTGFTPVRNLMPVLSVHNRKYILLTSELAGIPRNLLGARVCDLSAHRNEIISALDFLFTGF
jgi:toxin CcdB